MELRHLRCLVAVAEELHFGRAAQRLHLSQPPVSLAIKELEDELGVALFERTSRRIAITRAGEDALHDARAVLAGLETMRRRAHDGAAGVMGSIAVGFISLPAYSFLPPTLLRFNEAHPRASVALREGITEQIVADVEAGHLDVGMVLQPSDMPATLGSRLVQKDTLILALPEAHPLAGTGPVALEKFSNERFLGFERHIGPQMFDAIVATCMRRGFSPLMFPARQMNTIVSLVSGGVGIALVPACVKALHREGVVYRSLKGEKTYVDTLVVWRKSDESPLVKALLALLPDEGKAGSRGAPPEDKTRKVNQSHQTRYRRSP
ncbi:LysR family transcriptional regulator [Variovorax sp. RB3P1]|uniref:LysR family transcriptional regulator n=1 Tax=Variovorax sp. RB3P1 TaxID=3443732 RepID=UPI003F4676B6